MELKQFNIHFLPFPLILVIIVKMRQLKLTAYSKYIFTPDGLPLKGHSVRARQLKKESHSKGNGTQTIQPKHDLPQGKD